MPQEMPAQRNDDFQFENIFANLRIEFRVDAQDCLARLEAQLDGVQSHPSEAPTALSDLCREIHSLKGSGSSFGFPSVTVIAHRLESYVSGLADLDDPAINDVMVFLDRLRDILDRGDDSEENTAEIVRTLPVHRTGRMADIEGPNLEVLLVPSTPIIGRAVEGEFKLQGCRVTMLTNPMQAFEMAIHAQPDVLVASAVSKDISGIDLAAAFHAMKVTRNITFALLTSFPRSHPEFKDLPEDVMLIRHDQDLPGEIARLREQVAEKTAA